MQTKRSLPVVLRRDVGVRAFTLIELLVVIAIIGLLVAVLLPVLSKSKETARAICCVNHIHQLGVGATVYSSDAGRFPTILQWVYPRTNVNLLPKVPDQDLTLGQLYPYINSKQVYRCPTDPVTATSDVSYQVPCMMCHSHDASACLFPSRTVLFVEITNMSRTFYDGMANLPSPSRMAFRHKKRENFMMVDTHIETMTRAQYDQVYRDLPFYYPTRNVTRDGPL